MAAFFLDQTKRNNAIRRRIYQQTEMNADDFFRDAPHSFLIAGGTRLQQENAIISCCKSYCDRMPVIILHSTSDNDIYLSRSCSDPVISCDSSSSTYRPFWGMPKDNIVRALSGIAREFFSPVPDGFEALCYACIDLLQILDSPCHLSALLYIASQEQSRLLSGINTLSAPIDKIKDLESVFRRGPQVRQYLYTTLRGLASATNGLWQERCDNNTPLSLAHLSGQGFCGVISLCLPFANNEMFFTYLAAELESISTPVFLVINSVTIDSSAMCRYITREKPYVGIGVVGSSILSMLRRSDDDFMALLALAEITAVLSQNDRKQSDIFSSWVGTYYHIAESTHISSAHNSLFRNASFSGRDSQVTYSEEERPVISSKELVEQSEYGGYILSRNHSQIIYVKKLLCG